jgi:hypothetical protein
MADVHRDWVRSGFEGDHCLHDVLPGAHGQGRVTVLQIDLGDLQIHRHMADGFIAGVNEALGFVGVIDSQTLPLFGVGVETVIGIAVSAID